MNNKKFCFIFCANDEIYEKEAILYLNHLEVPDGYEVEILSIWNASSMAAGYNEGMRASDAKYKIYLHQDVLVRNRKILYDILNLFEDPSIGMIGVVGTERLPDDGVMWHGKRFGDFYHLEEILEEEGLDFEQLKTVSRDAMAIDGLLMITQYDLPWREDLFQGWDFYDISQCMEFRKTGYRIVVPVQKEVWFIHDSFSMGLWHYNEERKKFLHYYSGEVTRQSRGRVLFPHTKEIRLSDIPWALLKLGYEVEIHDVGVFLGSFERWDSDIFSENLKKGCIDYVFTHDFSPFIAAACEENGVKYISWLYDSPQKEVYRDEAKLSCNYIFAFDRRQKERLEGRGIPQLYHLPLATNVDRVSGMVITPEDEKKYGCDVSFVGSLYDVGVYEFVREQADEETIGEIDRVVDEAMGRWDGENRLFGLLSDRTVEFIRSLSDESPEKIFHMDDRYFLESLVLARRLANLERREALSRLALSHRTRLYTSSDIERLGSVEVKGKVNYEEELPKVYHLSRINLNLTLHCIETGAPQRIFDIMGAGGFVLSNYQEELAELFIPDKEIVLFTTLDEMVDKARYYLSHEEERLRIAMSGYRKVKECYTYERRLKEILDCVECEAVGSCEAPAP